MSSGPTSFAVVVGGDGSLMFSPPEINGAKIGDTIQWQFMDGNHSVISSDFDNPCQPSADLRTQFYSGFMPVPEGAERVSLLGPGFHSPDTDDVATSVIQYLMI